MLADSKGWIYTKDLLPPIDMKVLIIAEIGKDANFASASYTNNGIDGNEFMFRPGGLKPHVHVRWWMPIPQDGWYGVEEKQPEEGQSVLVKDTRGHINSAWWVESFTTRGKFEFVPFTGAEIVFWRKMPPLPQDDKLLAKLKLSKIL